MFTPHPTKKRDATDISESRSDLSLTGGLSVISVEHFSLATVAPLVTRFIDRCSAELRDQSTKELPVTIKDGDWSAYEVDLAKRFMGVTATLSQHIVSRLTPPTSALHPDDIALNLRWGGFQIHTDTNICFWLGVPSTRGDFEHTIRESIDEARPFECEKLRQLLADILQLSVYTGSVLVPSFSYAAVTPDFVTLRFCQKASR